MRRAARCAFLVAALGAACAEPAFSPHLPDNVALDLQTALGRSAATGAGEGVAYLVTAAPRELVAWDLKGGRARWRVPSEVSSRVQLGRGVVAYREGAAAVVVRDAADGRERCKVPLVTGESLVGVAAGARVFVATEARTPTGSLERALVAYDTTTCAPAWRDEARLSMGAPVARGDVVAVPYARQGVVLLDGATGDELARVRSVDDEVAWVRATREGFFYGSTRGVHAVAATGTPGRGAPLVAHLASEMLHTFYSWDAYQASLLDYTAFDRNRLLWRADVTDGGAARFRGDMAYLVSFRYLFGFDAATGAVRWAWSHPRTDLVGSADAGAAILWASTDGDLGAVDAATGVVGRTWSTGLRLAGATFDAEGLAAEATGPAAPLATALPAIVWDTDARFTAVKVFAVDALARAPGVEATRELLKIVLGRGVAPAVASHAAEALVARRDTGALGDYRAALARTHDYLAEEQPQAVDVLARVAEAVGDTGAVPLLAAQLADPATPTAQLKEIVKAIVALGGADAVEPLGAFLLAYHADPAFASDTASLALAGHALLDARTAEARRLVTFVADDARTLPMLGRDLRQALSRRAQRDGGAPHGG